MSWRRSAFNEVNDWAQSGKLFSNKNGKEREVDRALEPKEGLEKFVNFLNKIGASADTPSASGDENETKEKIVLV